MTKDEWDKLEEGDIIRNEGSGMGYIVSGNYKALGVVLVRTLLAHHRNEWKVVQKAGKDD